MSETKTATGFDLTGEALGTIAKEQLNLFTMDEKQTDLAAHMVELIMNGGTLGDLYHFTSKDLELIYSIAHTFYGNGKYEKALSIFQFLTLHNHINPKWWIGLGSTWQMLKDYEKAVSAYGMATILDIDNPKPQLQAGYCLIMMGKKEEAKAALEGAIMCCDGGSPSHALFKTQAEALLKTL